MHPPTTDLDVDQQPPLALPFAHFLAGAVLLLLGGGIASLGPLVLPIRASSAGTLHLLLAGWLGLTIMGAMYQFVPVWSGTRLYSERLSIGSLWLVVLGIVAVVGVFFSSAYGWFPLAAGVLLLGFWLFGYTIIRSLPPVRNLDITGVHFLVAIGNLLVATVFGWLLASDFAFRVLDHIPVTQEGILLAHLTLTVFGFVLLTIVGALYQLTPMVTQSDAKPIDTHLAHFEMIALPAGVILLATGRLFGLLSVARFGAVLFLVGLFGFALLFLRRLWTARVESSPMLRRYWLVGLSISGWVGLTTPRWLGAPLSYFLRFGSPQGTHLLFVGVFTIAVIGTFYHVIPFIIRLHEDSDGLEYAPVPVAEALYHPGLARLEFWFLLVGLGALWGGEIVGAPTWVLIIGGNVLGVGVVLFAFNMALLVWRYRPEIFREVFDLVVF